MAGRVLIFGVNGFVGGWLTREFAEHGYEVVGSDLGEAAAHEGLPGYFPGDLLDAGRVAAIVRDAHPDIVINLAAISSVGQSWKVPALTMQVNVVGTINILEAARTIEDSPKVLLVGSSEEYAPSDKPLKETDQLDATNPYGISKVTQERVAELYGERYDLRIYRTRSFNHTGPGQSTKFVIPSWCKQVADIEKSGKPGVIHVGNLDVVRDFSDVRDVVRAYRMILESDYAGEVFNVGSGRAVSLRKLLAAVVVQSSQHVDVVVDENRIRPTDTPFICGDVNHIATQLDWEPSFPIERTIADLTTFYAES